MRLCNTDRYCSADGTARRMSVVDATGKPVVLHQLPDDSICHVAGFLDSYHHYVLQCTCRRINAVIGKRDITVSGVHMNQEYMATVAARYPFLARLSVHIDDHWQALDQSVSRVTFQNLRVLVFASKGSVRTKQDVDCAFKSPPADASTLLHEWVPQLQVLDIGSLNQNDISIVTRMLAGHRFRQPLCIVNTHHDDSKAGKHTSN